MVEKRVGQTHAPVAAYFLYCLYTDTWDMELKAEYSCLHSVKNTQLKKIAVLFLSQTMFLKIWMQAEMLM